MRIDEAVSVSTTSSGEPIGFNWRGIAFLVRSRPTRWFARREWWVEAARAHRGIGSGIVEVEMWRLQAGQELNVEAKAEFELIHSTEDGVWRLTRVWG